MAGPWYVDSAAGGTGDGLSWVNACTTMATVLGKAVVAGDTIYVRNTHSESTASAVSWTFPGTVASPNRVICATNADQPPLSADLIPASGSTTPPGAGTAATFAATGANGIAITGNVFFRGCILNVATSTNAGNLGFVQALGNIQSCALCSLNIVGTGANARFLVGTGAGGAGYGNLDLINTSLSFGNATDFMRITVSAFVRWRGPGSVLNAGSAIPTTLINPNTTQGGILCLEDVDLSQAGSGHTLLNMPATGAIGRLVCCKLGASVTVASGQTIPLGGRVDLINCDSGATNYRNERYDYAGTLTTSTSVYNNATDGATPISWKIITTANADPTWPFECIDIVQWAPAGTYAATVIQCTSATASLTNADIWVEADYLGSASYPQGSIASSGIADPLAAGSALAAGSWATGGVGHNYQLALPSFTTNMAGYIRFTVKIAKASLTIYVDPAVTVA